MSPVSEPGRVVLGLCALLAGTVVLDGGVSNGPNEDSDSGGDRGGVGGICAGVPGMLSESAFSWTSSITCK